MKFISTLAVALPFAISVSSAQAATFDFSYVFGGGGVLSGAVSGEISGGGDTVLVDAIENVAINGAAAPETPVVSAFSEFERGSGLSPSISFSGDPMDLIACADASCSEGFGFAPDDGFGALALSSPAFLSGFEAFDAARWSLTPRVAEAPLPGAGLLLLGALGALAAARRRAG